jgi:hypothetical protein
MPDQTDDPYGNQRVATVDDLTNEQFAKLIMQAQKVFGLRSQEGPGQRAEVCTPAGMRFALEAVHRHTRQPQEEE